MSTQGLAVFLVLIRAALCAEFIGCPKNLTTYLGCNKTVTTQLNISPDQSSNCTDDYNAFVQLNGEVDVKRPDIIAIPNSSLCSISLTFPVLELFYDVKFIATHTQSSPQGFDTINCTDLIKVHDSFPSPNMNNIQSSTLCNGILIEWRVPELEDGSLVTQFIFEVEGTNITYPIVNGTSVLIPYDELQFNSEYTVGIYTLHCDRLGNGTSVSIRTAIVPQLANDTSVIQEVKNRSHAVVTFVKNVTNLGCDVSYPSAVDIEILKTSDLNRTFVKYNSREVTVTDNGTIAVSLMLPVDNNYSGSFVWKNHYFNSSDKSITFDTNQLQSCVFRVDRNRIVFSCLYAVGSTLQGCKVTAIDESNRHNYTNISQGDTGEHGVISNMCAGVYSVRCEGKVDTDQVISYRGNQYTTRLELTRASDCHMLSTTTSSILWPFTSVTSPSEPPTGPVQEGEGKNLIAIIVPAVVSIALLILIILIIIALVVIKINNSRKHKYSPTSVEEGEIHETNSHVYVSMDDLIDHGAPNGTETGPIGPTLVIANVPKGSNNEQMPTRKKEETDEERKGELQVTVSLSPPGNIVGRNKLDDKKDLSVEKKVQFQEERSEDVHPRTGDVPPPGHTRSKSLTDEETDRSEKESKSSLRRGSEPQSVPEPKPERRSSVSSLRVSHRKKEVENQHLLKDITASTSEAQEDSATPPSDNKPTVSAEFVPPTRRPSVFSQLSSIVSGISPLGSSPAPRASDSETKDLIPSTSEPNDSMENVPVRSSHSGSAGEATGTGNNDQVTSRKETMEPKNQSSEATLPIDIDGSGAPDGTELPLVITNRAMDSTNEQISNEQPTGKREEMERELQDAVSLNKPGNAVDGNKSGGDYQRIKTIKENSKTHSNIERRGSDNQPVPKAKEPKRRWSVSSLSQEVLSKSFSPTKKGAEYQYLLDDITASTSEAQEDSATPPSDNKPTVSTEFVPPTRRPSVFSQLSSFVPGMSPLGSSPAPQASDSETKDLISSTSEPMEYHGEEMKEQPKTTSPHHEVLEKSGEDKPEQTIDHEGNTSSSKHIPGRSSHSGSAGEATSTGNDDQVTSGKEIMEKASQQTEKSSADAMNKEKEIGNSVAVGMTKSESQYSVHVSHEEQVSNQDNAYTYIPQYNGNKT